MNSLQAITADQMVGIFLSAELHSSRFRAGSLKALDMLGFKADLIEQPDYNDADQNKKRAATLGLCRGWPNRDLFTSFPANTKWFLGTIEQDELATASRLKSSTNMTDTERILSVTAQKINDGTPVKNIDPDLIHQIAEQIKHAILMPPIILVSDSIEGKKVLIEGHSRSTAYTLLGDLCPVRNIPAIIGLSPDMPQWAYF
jgi:hypothetical protein